MYYAIGFIALVFLIVFGLAMTKPTNFNYERSGIIQAPPEVIFPYLNDFKKGSEWSPYEKVDLNMKKTYSGPETGVGSVMEFDGNSNVGTGRLEIKNAIPNQMVEIELHMLKPFEGVNTIRYTLTPEQEGTRFTWTMAGGNSFMFKVVSVFIDCEKMVTDQFSTGIASLKSIAEAKQGGSSAKLNLNETPEMVTLPTMTLLYIEKIGPFMKQAPIAWKEFWEIAGKKIDKKNMMAMMGLSKIDHTKKGDDAFVYQAGITVKEKTASQPHPGLKMREIPSGRYARFLLTGSYAQLAQAYPRILELVPQLKLNVRKDFFIESYLNSPVDTPEEKLQTEILVPIE